MAATYLKTVDLQGNEVRHYFAQNPVTQEGELFDLATNCEGISHLNTDRTPAPINLYSDPTSRWSILVHINQPVVVDPANISSERIRIEWFDGVSWVRFGTDVALVANCTDSGAVIELTPRGILPQGRPARVNIKQGFSDLTGDSLPSDLQNAARLQVDPLAGTAANLVHDQHLETFTLGGGGVASNEDISTALSDPRANWGSGRLDASFEFGGTGGPGSDFDWHVGFFGPETFFLDTTTDQILGGANGVPTVTQTIINGVVDVRNLKVLAGSKLVVIGPNPCTILARGTIEVLGEIIVNGGNSTGVGTLNTTNQPEVGAAGNAAGGQGGTASFLTAQSTPKGGDGSGPYGAANRGGRGGETTFATGGIDNRRGSGGGGGRTWFDVTYDHDGNPATPQARCQTLVGMDVESGRGGGRLLGAQGIGLGAISQTVRTTGGAVGPLPFLDDNTNNNFLGTMVTADNQLIQGELSGMTAGSGGGGGGDAVNFGSFPLTPFNISGDEKGAGAGGGAGALRMLAIGDITVRDGGRVMANGGHGGGGENSIFFDRVGGGSGGGSAGHIIFSSASSVIIEGEANTAAAWYSDNPILATHSARAVSALGGQGGAGEDDNGGAQADGVTQWKCDCIPREFVDLAPINVFGSPCMAGAKDVPPFVCAGGCQDFGLTLVEGPGYNSVRGAGGDGGPGLVQVHVANPTTDFLFPDLSAGQGNAVYGRVSVTNGVTTVNALDVTGAMAPPPLGWNDPEACAAAVAARVAIDPLFTGNVACLDTMVPFFGPESIGQSSWIPFGLARINPVAGGSPTAGDVNLGFLGTDTANLGRIDVIGTQVDHDTDVILPAAIDPAGIVAPFLSNGELSMVFDATLLDERFKLNPFLVVGYSIRMGNTAVAPASKQLFTVGSASYDMGSDRLICTIEAGQGDLGDFQSGTGFASLVPHQFRVASAGIKDFMPTNSAAYIQFDATVFDASGLPSETLAYSVASNGGEFTGDVADLNVSVTDWDFFRFKVIFDLNDGNLPTGVDLTTARPGLLFVNTPFSFGSDL